MKKQQPRILFVSNEPIHTGAPICLLSIIRYLKENYNWDMKLVCPKDGTLYSSFEKLIPSYIFYRNDLLVLSEFGAPENLNKFHLNELKICLQKKDGFALTSIKEFAYILKSWGYSSGFRKMQHIYQKRLARQISRWKPDLIFSNTIVNEDILDELNLAAPTLLYVHELENAFKELTSKQLKNVENRPDHYITVSNANYDNLIENHNISGDNITIIPCGLCVDDIKAKAETEQPVDIQQAFGISKNNIVVGAVGTASNEKGVNIFFDMANAILKQNKTIGVSFVWVGGGRDLEKCQQQAAESPYANQIHFVGQKENPYPYINVFDIYIITSHEDSFPLANLEAALFSCPIVAFSDSGGSKEFIEDDAGFHVPDFSIEAMSEKVKLLIDDKKLRLKMGAAAKKKVLENYTIAQSASKVGSLIEKRYFSKKY